MADVQIKFEREGLEGVIPTGSYLSDVMRRMGIPISEECNSDHECIVTVVSGEELLSPLTSLESERLMSDDRKPGERLACHARIEKAGEIVVMTKENKEQPKADDSTTGEKYREQFTELPLEQKITELVKLEAIALGDTFSFIANSPYLLFDKLGDVMAQFGIKQEKKSREAKRPAEHHPTDNVSEENKSETETATAEQKT